MYGVERGRIRGRHAAGIRKQRREFCDERTTVVDVGTSAIPGLDAGAGTMKPSAPVCGMGRRARKTRRTRRSHYVKVRSR